MKKQMKTLGNTRRIIALTLMTCAFCVPVNAQTTWIGGGGDNDWNNVGNWDVEIPSAFVSGTIPSSFTVDYDTPMVAPNIFGLTLGGGTLDHHHRVQYRSVGRDGSALGAERWEPRCQQ